MQEKEFHTIHIQLKGLHARFNSSSLEYKQKGQALKQIYVKEMATYNANVSKGIVYVPNYLMHLDSQLGKFRDSRISTHHELLNELNPVAEKFLSLFDVFEAGVIDKTIELDLLLNYLSAARNFFDDSNNLLVYSTEKAEAVKRATKKYLKLLAHIVSNNCLN